jgi:hypothetical protein
MTQDYQGPPAPPPPSLTDEPVQEWWNEALLPGGPLTLAKLRHLANRAAAWAWEQAMATLAEREQAAADAELMAVNGWLRCLEKGPITGIRAELTPYHLVRLARDLRAARRPKPPTLAQPTPPAEGEVAELVEWIHRQAVHGPDADEWRRAAELLAQRYPEPVPVGEEPWEREGWCDELGRCWFGAPQDGAADAGWILRKPSERLSHQTVSLPAHALPLPAGEVK